MKGPRIMEVSCSRCGVGPSEACRTPGGKKTQPHANRTAALHLLVFGRPRDRDTRTRARKPAGRARD